MNLQAHREVKSIVDEIPMNVSDAIDVIYVHDMVEDIVLDMVEEAMHRSRQREIQNASLRHDLEVIDYRRNRYPLWRRSEERQRG